MDLFQVASSYEDEISELRKKLQDLILENDALKNRIAELEFQLHGQSYRQ